MVKLDSIKSNEIILGFEFNFFYVFPMKLNKFLLSRYTSAFVNLFFILLYLFVAYFLSLFIPLDEQVFVLSILINNQNKNITAMINKAVGYSGFRTYG